MSTILIVASSLTLIMTHVGMARDQLKLARRGLLLTSLLGVGFVVSQVAAWNQLQSDGFLPSTHNFGGMFYLLSFLHGLHVFGGLLLLRRRR